jgi:hypothetical protein
MRRWVIAALAILLVAGLGAEVATAAPSPAQLQRQIKALQRQVNTLQRTVASLVSSNATQDRCESVVPVASYGRGSEGYLYTTNGGVDVFITTALDFVPDTDLGDPNSFEWMLTVDNSCVSTSSSRPVAKAYPRAGPMASIWSKQPR